MENNKIHVIGMAVEKYIGTGVSGHNCHFNYAPEEFERYKLLVRDDCGTRYVITLDHSEGECGSGWCCASWGIMRIERALTHMPFTHVPKVRDLVIEGFTINYDCTWEQIDDGNRWGESEYCYNNVFNYSKEGGDAYYPSGFASVKMDLFRPLKRYPSKRPVYLIVGKSGIGKTTLASHLNDMKVYETDCSLELPEVITADVVVIGNRSQFTVEDVKARLFGDPKVVVVTMS